MAGSGGDRSWAGSSTSTRWQPETTGQERCPCSGTPHGKWLLRASEETLSADDLADADKQLIHIERGWRDRKGALGLRPVFRHPADRIRAHVQLCWLALPLMRVIENATAGTWPNLRHELDRMALVTLGTADGQVGQRSITTTASEQSSACCYPSRPGSSSSPP